ncbi:MAG: hypothetical protein Q9172_005448 [Xanthocarpia lactea]
MSSTSTSPTTTLYILYNADASLIGKLNYGFRKLTASSKDKPACAACDITHGGLHLDETVEWKKVKEGLIAGDGGKGVELKQLHRDEVGGEVREYVESNKYRYPMVLMGEAAGGQGYKLVMDHEELAACNGNAQQFVLKLREKGVFGAGATKTGSL